ncbi:MAG: methyltransferase regulatory domain-containing protein [Janthinobacterium lividum]
MPNQANVNLTKYYDEVPYQSHPFPQTAVEHLATRAFLFGLDAPSASQARVLELGCAGAGNLIPYAGRFPGARVVGVDLSTVQIAQGLAAVERAGLKNIELYVMDLADIGESLGRFDYIICHGVYSWVPDRVQNAILRICEQNLSPHRIAYISYNVYPGWKAREIVRDAMLLRGGPRETPEEKLSFARGMLDFLEQSAKPDSVLTRALEKTMPIVRDGRPAYLLHEFFEPFNAPCYFKEFLERAGKHDLAYLSESDSSSMFIQNYAEKVREPLIRECDGSQIVMEQYLDFLVDRTFRQTLLVKADKTDQIRYRLDPQRIGSLYLAGKYEAADESPLTLDHVEQLCTALGNRSVMLRNPVHKAVALTLSAQFPATMNFDEIVAAVRSLVDESEVTVRTLTLTLTLAMVEELVILGSICVRHERPEIAADLSSHPRVLDANRLTFASFPHGDRPNVACNQWHESTTLSPLQTFLMPLLDGNRSCEALEFGVTAAAQTGQLIFSRQGQPIEGRDVPPVFVGEELTLALQGLRRKGILVG